MMDAAWDDAPCALLEVDLEGRLRRVNQTLLSWVGAERAALLGCPVTDLFTPAGRLMWHAHVMPELLHGQPVEDLVVTLRQRGGGSQEVQLNATRRPAAAGQASEARVHVACMRVQARAQLEQRLRTLQRLATEAPGMLFQLRQAVDGSLSFTYVNEAVRTLFGCSPSVVLRDPSAVWARLDPDHLAQWHEGMTRAAHARQAWVLQYRVRHGAGWVWHEAQASPVHEPDGSVLWHGHAQDITAHRQLLQDRQDKALAERDSQAKSAFLARMSHELRTPLHGILGFARLLSAPEGGLSGAHRERAEFIVAAGDNLLRLVNDVLDISRIEAGQLAMSPEPVLLERIWQEALRLLSPQIAARRAQLVTPSRLGVWVLADPGRLLQVVLNVLSNALKYGPLGGTVRLEVRIGGALVTLSVSDEGPGLSPAQQAALFQPFNRLGAEGSTVDGVGLGLVISKGLIEQMGGPLGLDRGLGPGATFDVCLPLATPPLAGAELGDSLAAPLGPMAASAALAAPLAIPAPMAPSAAAPAPKTAPKTAPSSGLAVLYVEDNHVNAILMQAVFDLQDRHQLHVAPDAAAALARVRTWRPDVFLLDMHLPGTDGLQLLSALRGHAHLRDVPAVAVSADAMPCDIERALAAGFDAYWTKPLDVGRIVAMLEAVMAQAQSRGGIQPRAPDPAAQ